MPRLLSENALHNQKSARPAAFAVIEQDGYELDNVVTRAAENPGSFFIPAYEERVSLVLGDYVKLVFILECHDQDGTFLQGERMWVEVNKIEKTEDNIFYTGELGNEPVCSSVIHLGAQIRFSPEHVACILVRRTDPRHPDYSPVKQ